MKPLGDAFIKLIKMAIGLVIFFTVVSGIGGMQSMKKVGRVGGKALIYFEVVSTLALVIGIAWGGLQRRPRQARCHRGRAICRQSARAERH
jgi:aerobic C4-dicarboxylate transport protein